ncbi:fatty acid desaturase [Thraustotheca clavata]|uniref:Fatty acid desaturase n=1 Tax=Thraustotheca clavata TaxID=74557 RepID=A0A1V9ZWE3_9STRA|nr:fatty acid desaturase [Thraustotheca clavata]
MCQGQPPRKSDVLRMAGYRAVEGAPEPLPLDPPTITLKDIRAAIPAHCFERSALTSSYYMVKNIAICAALFYAGLTFANMDLPIWVKIIGWPVYWFVQGTYFTGIWVIAHECGHQAFSDSEYLNDTVGIILHSLLFVPYHSWKITHRRHHSNTGSCENDEVFTPSTRSKVEAAPDHSLWEESPLYNLYGIFMMLLVGWMPGYLFFNATGPSKYVGKSKSHFNPYAAFFLPKERLSIWWSDICFVAALVLFGYGVSIYGIVNIALHYIVPYLICNAYLVLITYLQHTDTFVPHFRGEEWNWLRGALCTVDRSFGAWIDSAIHHISDTHVTHHIFSKMPFYHAAEATEAIKPLLGKYYLIDSTPIPMALWRSYTHCKYVEDDGSVVFYKRKLHDK